MKGLYYPITFVQGETFELPFSVQDDGVVWTPSEYNFAGNIRNKELGDITDVATFDFTISVEDPEYVIASILSTNDIQTGEFLYEIRMTNTTTSRVQTILYGSAIILRSLVRTTAQNGLSTVPWMP